MKSLYAILFFMVVLTPQLHSAKTKTKPSKTSTQSRDAASQRAIIAIEIVDPNENSTNSKQSKRTIENALGYGYNSYDKPRYEVYKYSQHDIPPYKGNPASIFTGSSDSVEVEKSVQYTLPTVTQQVQDNGALKPGTTLYSSLNAQGQVGGLTSSLSSIPGLEHNQAPVPVIVLRIYPDQLKDSTIQANLPKSHPFSKRINSINIQSLLEHYIKALQNPSSLSDHQEQTEVDQSAYSAPSSGYNSYQSQTQSYSAPTQNYNSYQPQYQQSGSYQTSSQYYQQPSYYQKPGYHQQQNSQYSDYSSGKDVQVQQLPVKYHFRYQSPSVSQKHSSKKARPVKQPQFYYVQPNSQTRYTTEPSGYYQTSQPLAYIPQDTVQQHASPQEQQQYYSANQVEQQYQNYYQEQQQQQQQPYDASQKFLTSENYPSDSHTRVVFKTDDGSIKTPEDPTPAKEIKTINIQVPDNVAKVEVQESERPYYSSYQSDQSYSEPVQNLHTSAYQNQESGPPAAEDNYYLGQDSVRKDYYNTADIPAEGGFDYQNVDYKQMAKYFVRRGAMPSYFFQNPNDVEDNQQKSLSKEDVVTAYEEAAFPSTTQSTVEKKVKSKKRT